MLEDGLVTFLILMRVLLVVLEVRGRDVDVEVLRRVASGFSGR